MRRYVCLDTGLSVKDSNGGEKPLKAFYRTGRSKPYGKVYAALGIHMIEEIAYDSNAAKLLVLLMGVMVDRGRYNEPNWFRLPRRKICAQIKSCPRSVSSALKKLLAKGIIERHPDDDCSYRFNENYLCKGELERMPAILSSAKDTFKVIIPEFKDNAVSA